MGQSNSINSKTSGYPTVIEDLYDYCAQHKTGETVSPRARCFESSQERSEFNRIIALPKNVDEEWLWRFGKCMCFVSMNEKSSYWARVHELESMVPEQKQALDKLIILHPERGDFNKLRKLMDVLQVGVIFHREAADNINGATNDQSLRKIWLGLQNVVYKDDQIDEQERLMLLLLGASYYSDYGAIVGAIPLQYLVDGYKIAEREHQSIELRTSAGRLYVYANFGEFTGSRNKLEADELKFFQDRELNRECFSFALSKSPNWNLLKQKTDFEIDILEQDYRMVDLVREAARPGDVVVYFSYRWARDESQINGASKDFAERIIPKEYSSGGVPHMGVVLQVDNKGWPTEAVSKFGFNKDEFYKHPVNRVLAKYGQFWGIFRVKTEK